MVIVYGSKNSIKIKKNLGVNVCPNCGMNTEKVLAAEKQQFTVFYIPIFSHTLRKGLICPNCGMYKTLTNAEFKEIANH